MVAIAAAASRPAQQPQIIVIPQSLLDSAAHRGGSPTVLRISPSGAAQVIAPAAAVQPRKHTTLKIQPAAARQIGIVPSINLSKTQPVSIKTEAAFPPEMMTVNPSHISGQFLRKRPLPSPNPSESSSSSAASVDGGYDSSGDERGVTPAAADDDADAPTVRKRANLDHLSSDEKLMRRKLKNRVAAQNARDKKRVKMDDMEAAIDLLQQESRRIKAENEKLLALNKALTDENAAFRRASVKIESCSPPPLNAYPLPAQALVTPDQGIVVPRAAVGSASAAAACAGGDAASLESAALSSTLPQQGIASPPSPPPPPSRTTASARGTAVETGAAATQLLLWTSLVTSLLSSSPSNPPSPSPHRIPCSPIPTASASSTNLPLKKRGAAWWGPAQGAWNPARPTTTT